MTESPAATAGHADVQKWIREVLRDPRRSSRIAHSRIEDHDHPRRLVVDVGGPTIHLGNSPPGWEVELAWRQEGSGPTEMAVTASTPPERVIVSAWPTLNLVKLGLEPAGEGWAGMVELRLVAAGEVVLNPGQVVVSHLAVHAGDLTVNSKAQPLRLDVHSASIDGVKRVSGQLALEGSVQLPSGFRSVKTVLVGNEATVQGLPPKRNVGAPNKEPPPIRLGGIGGTDSNPVRLAIEADVVAETLPPHSTVDVAKDARFIATGLLDHVGFRGEGSVRLVRASSASFGEGASVDLVLEAESMLEDTFGKVRSLRIEDATLTGLRKAPSGASTDSRGCRL